MDKKRYWLWGGVVVGVLVWASSMYFLIDGRFHNAMVPGFYQLDWYGRNSLVALLFFIVIFILLFSQKRYWLKGGLIGLIVISIFSLRRLFQSVCDIATKDGSDGCPVIIEGFSQRFEVETIYFIFFSFLLFIILGFFLGWLYGKIKSGHQ